NARSSQTHAAAAAITVSSSSAAAQTASLRAAPWVFDAKGAHANCRMPDLLLAVPHADGAVRLYDWGLILAEGPDAAAFLNGQLTQDMLHLADAPALLAGYCSPQGRLLATFVVWQHAPQTIALACSADLLAATLQRLSMYVLRA